MNHFARFSIGFALSLLAPLAASAHEHQTFEIGDKAYDFTIGSMNEPVVVDDKSGVELSIWTTGGAGAPVEGLESALKVELRANGQTKQMDLTPTWGEAGSYFATFYPTMETEYSYRVTGTMNSVPVDLLFTCSPAGHEMHATEPDTAAVKISDKVTRTLKSGRFGCPKPKENLAFPNGGVTLASLEQRANLATIFGIAGVAIGILALAQGRRRI